MALFNVTFTAWSMSPVIREMHTATRQIEANSLKQAQKIAKDAFATSVCWRLLSVTPTESTNDQ